MDRRRRFTRIAATALVPALALFTALGTAVSASASTTPSAAQRAEAAAVQARAAIRNLVVGFQHSPTLKIVGHGAGVKGQTQVESTNWSGYADTGSGFSKVTASWTEPTGASSGRRTTSLAAFWVGIDGYSSSTVEQDGTLIESYEGTVYYYDWWEIYPENDVQVVDNVSPGDHITSTVTRSGDSYTLSVTDSTHTGDSFSTTQTYSGAADSSAEWIAEAPSGSNGVYPLTDFGSWADSGSAVTEGSTSGVISSFTDDEITMINGSTGAVEAQPSALNSSGNGFTVTWESS
jgi:peptidase A4-like protein